jgi:N-acetyl-gamma-glutamyl-phosphate reductase
LLLPGLDSFEYQASSPDGGLAFLFAREVIMVKVGVVGATGYTGFELLKLFARHGEVELLFASSESYAGQRFSQVYPCPYDVELIDSAAAPFDQVDVVFLCTPHGASAGFARQVLAAGAKVVDLSADFRLRDQTVFEQWYGAHHAPELLPKAVYGLTEVYRADVAGASLVANPGCYPTGPLLALMPLLKAGQVLGDKVIIDAKSGVSGAGAKPSPTTHFCSVNENLSAYNVGHKHRHTPEIEQELSAFRGNALRAVFTPHLLPVSRGILTSIYVDVPATCGPADVIALWQQAYGGEPFIQVLPEGSLATLAHVTHTNRVALSVASAGVPGELILITAIDNLIKGASGQALQNMNVMFGLPETLGLV